MGLRMSQNNNITEIAESEKNFSQRELSVLRDSEANGVRPVALSLATSLYQLFLEGYSCLEISKQGKGLSEGDVLFLRKKYEWDKQRDQYALDLQNQVNGKLIKAKLEAVEFLTNQMAAIHKLNRDQVLKYLMSGNPDDMPKDLGKVGGYKQIIEVLQKITGEDKVSKVKTESVSTQNVILSAPSDTGLTQTDRATILKALSSDLKK